ncbi:MAG: TonB-dependent siderophore receptor [Caulobacter sp.]|nr:TonB-dependent siderophore receptor [Caulobacter sp.]
MSVRAALLASTILAAVAGPCLAHAAEADEAAVATAADADNTVSALTVEGQRLEDTASATGLTLSLRETPQSVTQIDRQQIEDFKLTNVNELLNQAVGVNVEKVETDRTYYNSRGFDITNFQVDGVGLPLIWGIQFGDLDTVMFERVDIVRGANGMLSGTGNPSATVNYIRKRPTSEFQASLTGAYGSWDDVRVEADVSGPLNASGTVRGRLVGAIQDNDSYLDYYSVNRNVIYGVLTWDITPDFSATVGYSRQDNNADGVLWGALPLVYSDGARINWDRSASTSADWTYWDTLDEQAFAELTYRFANGWNAKATYTHKIFEERAQLLYAFGNPDPITGLGVSGMTGIYPSRYEQDLFEVSWGGPVTLFGREHEVIFGGSYAKGTGKEYEDFALSYPDYPSIFDWGKQQVAEPTYPGAYLAAFSEDKMSRAYGAAHLNLADNIKGVVGLNIVKVESTGESYGTPTLRDESAISPYLGLVVDLNTNVSLYASYTDIFNPQSEIDITRKPLDAAHGKSYELGVKSEWFGGRLYATAAVFKSEQYGLASAAGVIPGSADTYYEGVDTFVEGYELEVAGRVNDRWTVSGGWTQLSIEDEAGDSIREYTPRKTLKLQTTYSIPELRDLKLGAAVRWQSKVGTQDLVWVEQDSYAVVDVMAGVNLTDQVRATVNIKNLFDETYLTSLMWNQSYFAAPRSASVTLNYSF